MILADLPDSFDMRLGPSSVPPVPVISQ
ncbi:uncharacterized protein METZ01_LOCUS201805 [marine metagenome]|uniref:Uncharacterized protein n=1 Tax=marine metagenome TaxID=408172 RepID=A0A382EG53_9ZZZZ